MSEALQVSEKNTPSEKETLGKMGLQHNTSEGGEQLLQQDRMAKARVKGTLFRRHRRHITSRDEVSNNTYHNHNIVFA